MNPPHSDFAGLLRRHRQAAGFTQQELAERSGISLRSISDLERGFTASPRKDTVSLLAETLQLPEAARTAFEAAARGSGRAVQPELSSPTGASKETEADARRLEGNIPPPLTSFVGREQEQAEIGRLLGETRILTLVGIGGAGKSRLAVQVAHMPDTNYLDGVWLVELAPLSDPELVAQAIATALDVVEEAGQPLWSTLVAHLQSRRLLIVLDNCEHLIQAAAEIVHMLLLACTDLRILATSREALEVPGEIIFRVPPLSRPDPAHITSLESLIEYEAVRLFVERARARRPDFALTDQNAAAVTEICARLDGIPLAVELAAARVGALPVETIAARLDDRFRLLTGGPRTVMARQQTLRAALDWSHDLLGEGERVLLRRLSVFAGGCTLEAAETVCGDSETEWNVLEILPSLVHKSLLQLDTNPSIHGEARYNMLETVRQYGRERLEDAGEATMIRERQLTWYVQLAEQAEQGVQGSEQDAWLTRLEREHDNFRAALAWSIDGSSHPDEGLQIAGCLWRFWWVRGHYKEGQHWLASTLATATQARDVDRARALNGSGYLAYCLNNLAVAESYYARTLDLRRAIGDQRGIAATLANLGLVANLLGNYDRAEALLEESLALRRRLEDQLGIAVSLSNLSLVARETNRPQWAEMLLEEGLAICRALQHKHGMAITMCNLGWAMVEMRQYTRAGSLLRHSLELAAELGDKDVVAECLEGLAALVPATDESAGGPIENYLVAARLLGAARLLRDTAALHLPPAQHARYQQALSRVRTRLGDHAFDEAWAGGRAMSVQNAAAYALNSAQTRQTEHSQTQ